VTRVDTDQHHCLPVGLSRRGRSFQFGRAAACAAYRAAGNICCSLPRVAASSSASWGCGLTVC